MLHIFPQDHEAGRIKLCNIQEKRVATGGFCPSVYLQNNGTSNMERQNRTWHNLYVGTSKLVVRIEKWCEVKQEC